jgi:hypothetical protein
MSTTAQPSSCSDVTIEPAPSGRRRALAAAGISVLRVPATARYVADLRTQLEPSPFEILFINIRARKKLLTSRYSGA